MKLLAEVVAGHHRTEAWTLLLASQLSELSTVTRVLSTLSLDRATSYKVRDLDLTLHEYSFDFKVI